MLAGISFSLVLSELSVRGLILKKNNQNLKQPTTKQKNPISHHCVKSGVPMSERRETCTELERSCNLSKV